MAEISSENNLVLYEGLRESLKDTVLLIQRLTQEIRETSIQNATLEARLESLSEDVKTLTRIVRDGDGSKSVVTRLALIEEEVATIISRDAEFRKFIYSKLEKTHDLMDGVKELEKKTKNKTNKVQYNREKIISILQILPGVISLIAIIVQFFI